MYSVPLSIVGIDVVDGAAVVEREDVEGLATETVPCDSR